MAWIDQLDALNSAIMGAFEETIGLHFDTGYREISGIYSELVDDSSYEGVGMLRTDYRLDIIPQDAEQFRPGDQLTVRGVRFAYVKQTPNNGLTRIELRKV